MSSVDSTIADDQARFAALSNPGEPIARSTWSIRIAVNDAKATCIDGQALPAASIPCNIAKPK